jgi:hypothetical protein
LLPNNWLEMLQRIKPDPVQWDEAAVQLERLNGHVRQTGYPMYLYGLLSAARTAQAAGEKRITAIEFGVAGGNGLVVMEKHAEVVERQYDLSIEIVGFDMASGLPPRTEPRDSPFAYQSGEFEMNVEKLRSRLKRATLRLGDVSETIPQFMQEDFAPIGFVSNDLDLYTSTRDSLALFRVDAHRLLPRVSMYFDDLIGYPVTTAVAEWAAIKEFNTLSPDRQIGQIYGLKHCLGKRYRFALWPEVSFVLHVFDHGAYNNPEVSNMPDLGLR